MERGFRGVWIPVEVWFDERLSAIDKIVFAGISNFECDGVCDASNENLAAFCLCSKRKISDAIGKLKDFGYLSEVFFDGRIRGVHVNLK